MSEEKKPLLQRGNWERKLVRRNSLIILNVHRFLSHPYSSMRSPTLSVLLDTDCTSFLCSLGSSFKNSYRSSFISIKWFIICVYILYAVLENCSVSVFALLVFCAYHFHPCLFSRAFAYFKILFSERVSDNELRYLTEKLLAEVFTDVEFEPTLQTIGGGLV